MWLVPKETDGRTRRTDVPAPLKNALTRWYQGTGSDADHRASVTLVVKAREAHQWLACDCLGAETRPPLMSPAYLSQAETYYLRRLTSQGQGRALHHQACPFYLPQAPDRIRDTPHAQLYRIDGFQGLFNAHKLAPEKLAQEPASDEPDTRSRGLAIPRLAKLMWKLIENANVNTIGYLPSTGRDGTGIKDQFAALRRASARFEIAPGVPLPHHLYFAAEAYQRLQVHARLRKAARTWPHGFAPQAFLLVEAHEIAQNTIITGLGTIEVRNRIQHSGIIHGGIEPPFLCLVVVGEHNASEGYLALRAYAQPVFKGNRFIPVHFGYERELLDRFIGLQYRLRRDNISAALRRPLFDAPTRHGPMRPDFVIQATDWRTGEEHEWALQLLRSADPAYLELKARERASFEAVSKVVTVTVDDIASDTLFAPILADLGPTAARHTIHKNS